MQNIAMEVLAILNELGEQLIDREIKQSKLTDLKCSLGLNLITPHRSQMVSVLLLEAL